MGAPAAAGLRPHRGLALRRARPARCKPLPVNQAWSGLGLCIALILILLTWPGQTADNHWGPPTDRVNAIPALLGALCVAGAYAALIVFGLKLLPR
jgi:hypothetical protein